MNGKRLTVVYHAATMGDWAPLVREQMHLASMLGLREILCTHVGPNREALQSVAAQEGVRLLIMKSDGNFHHCETLAMLLMQELAQINDGAVLYWHTKGVSVPGSDLHRRWRRLMEREVVEQWPENAQAMDDHDVCGVGWGYNFTRPHFPGNFWMARWDWIRKLPEFVAYHHSWQLQRFSCEAWIGATPGARVFTRLCRDLQWHEIVARYMP